MGGEERGALQIEKRMFDDKGRNGHRAATEGTCLPLNDHEYHTYCIQLLGIRAKSTCHPAVFRSFNITGS